MLDEFDVQGIWHLPDEDINEKGLVGNLYSDKGDFFLDIVGSLSNLEEDIFKYNYIHGFTTKGEEITLINSYIRNENFNAPGLKHQRLIVNSFIVGGYLTDIDQAKFQSVKVSSTYLTKWFHSKPFTQRSSKNENETTEYSTSFIPPDINTFYLPYLDANIKNHYYFKSKGNFIDNMTYLYNEAIKITPSDWKNYDWFDDKLFGLNKLLTLLINEPIYFEHIIFLGEYEETDKSDDSKKRKEYHLYFSQGEIEIKERMHPHKMLFTFEDVRSNFENIFNNWFKKMSELKNVYNLHLGNFFNKNTVETKFLNAIQALEVYHRTQGHGKLFSDEDKNAYLHTVNESIKDVLPDKIKKEINKSLKHLNEYSLNKRLKDIIRNLNDDTITFLFGSRKKGKHFAYRLVNSRNFLTHYDEEGNE